MRPFGPFGPAAAPRLAPVPLGTRRLGFSLQSSAGRLTGCGSFPIPGGNATEDRMNGDCCSAEWTSRCRSSNSGPWNPQWMTTRCTRCIRLHAVSRSLSCFRHRGSPGVPLGTPTGVLQSLKGVGDGPNFLRRQAKKRWGLAKGAQPSWLRSLPTFCRITESRSPRGSSGGEERD